MAAGDIKSPNGFIVTYRAKGAGSISAGQIVAYDGSGNVIPATASTLGKHGVLTNLTHVVSGTTYYGVLQQGRIVVTIGTATVVPNSYVQSDANGNAIPATPAPSATVIQADLQMMWRIVGIYIRLESDNQYAASSAAAGTLAIIDVTQFT
jgi:hypothetical protein